MKNEAEKKAFAKSLKPKSVVRTNAPPRIHRHTLVEINKSVFTAKREAAHQSAVELLRREVFASQKERRAQLYEYCLRLVEDALTATQRSQLQQESPVTHYLQLLRETVNANLALVKHEMTLVREAAEFSRLLGDELISQFQTTSDVFSNSEMNVLDCIDGLLKFGEPIFVNDTAQRMQRFNEDERRRYEICLKEHQEHYKSSSP